MKKKTKKLITTQGITFYFVVHSMLGAFLSLSYYFFFLYSIRLKSRTFKVNNIDKKAHRNIQPKYIIKKKYKHRTVFYLRERERKTNMKKWLNFFQWKKNNNTNNKRNNNIARGNWKKLWQHCAGFCDCCCLLGTVLLRLYHIKCLWSWCNFVHMNTKMVMRINAYTHRYTCFIVMRVCLCFMYLVDNLLFYCLLNHSINVWFIHVWHGIMIAGWNDNFQTTTAKVSVSFHFLIYIL